ARAVDRLPAQLGGEVRRDSGAVGVERDIRGLGAGGTRKQLVVVRPVRVGLLPEPRYDGLERADRRREHRLADPRVGAGDKAAAQAAYAARGIAGAASRHAAPSVLAAPRSSCGW